MDDRERLSEIIKGFRLISEEMPLVMPLHPRTAERLEFFGLLGRLNGIECLGPIGYMEMLSLVKDAAVVLTDSGGLQEETTVLGVPCVTLQESTERPITVEQGTNRLVGWPVTADGLSTEFRNVLRDVVRTWESRRPEGWDGRASPRLVNRISEKRLARPFATFGATNFRRNAGG